MTITTVLSSGYACHSIPNHIINFCFFINILGGLDITVFNATRIIYNLSCL